MPTRPGFVTCRFGLQTNSQTFESPLDGSLQRRVLAGARWMATYTLPRMKRSDQAAWAAFFVQLRGMGNTFYAFDPDARKPRGLGLGTPLVNGAGQTGYSLNTKGWQANINGLLLPGDYFQVGSQLKQIVAPVNSDGSGNATIIFESILRASPNNNDPIIINNASCEMVLADDAQAMWECDRNGVFEQKTFTAREVFI
jgi:hypothetical protein